jgi:hypothetical protein
MQHTETGWMVQAFNGSAAYDSIRGLAQRAYNAYERDIIKNQRSRGPWLDTYYEYDWFLGSSV